MRHRILEICKDILIAALVCCLLLLAVAALPSETIRNHQWLSHLLQPMSPLLGLSQAELTYVQTELPALDATQPICISVKNEAGRSTAMWDFTALDTAFETYGGLLGQAMDTAEPFTPVTSAVIRSVLSGPSVSFHYACRLPASMLAYWLDAHMEQDAPQAEFCILAPRDGMVQLYLVGETACTASTQVPSGQLESLLEQAKPDGSRFAFEARLPLNPYCILPGQLPPIFSGFASNPSTPSYIDSLANDLGFNPYNESRYQDEAGTTYFSELNCSLQVTANGKITLVSAAADRFTAQNRTPEALVEMARQMLYNAAIPGNARLYLSGFRQDGETTVCSFDYYFNAIPLALSGGPAATVTFTGRSITQLQLQLVRFTRAEQPLYPLPVPQAAALLSRGAPLTLQYCITPDQMLTVGWKGA